MTHKPTAVIFDMDGTLVDVQGIRHLLHGPSKDFDAFHRASVDCPPHRHVIDAVHQAQLEGHTILIVTARKHRYRHHTAWWLALHEVPSEELHMRANHDARPDYEVKRDMLADILRDYQVVHAWDDNPHVLRLWSEHGIPTTTVPGWSERT